MAERLLAATRKGLFTIERGKNGKWAITKADFLAQNLPIVHANAAKGMIIACINHGHFGQKVHRSLDRGQSWTEVKAPAFPPPAEGEKPVVDMFGRATPSTLQLIWAMEGGGKDEDGRLWCGTIPGGLFRSDDNGDSWEINRPLWDDPTRKSWNGGGADWPGIHSVCVDPRDPRHVTIAISTAGVWVTTDGGKSWATRCKGLRAAYMPPEKAEEPTAQDPHIVVQCPGSPDHLWMQHHNGIFRSTNAGRKWEELPSAGPSVFGFAVAVHPKDPLTAWFVPAKKDESRIPVDGKVVVTRTRDGGKSFDVLKKGLPQKHAYDITYRHALDIDSTGNTLAFGTTTGSLWVTDDQGDSWQTVSEHLPPIYCVRFEK